MAAFRGISVPSYQKLGPNDHADPTQVSLNKQLREHFEAIRQLTGDAGPVNITNDFTIGSNTLTAGTVNVGAAQITSGNVPPEGQTTAPPGSIFINTKGGTGNTVWVKTTGQGKTGWVNIA